jgi:hypothetical protein
MYVGMAALLAAIASLVVAVLQLRQARTKPTVLQTMPSLPPGSRVRMDVNADKPGSNAQGVMFGSIHNRYEQSSADDHVPRSGVHDEAPDREQ